MKRLALAVAIFGGTLWFVHSCHVGFWLSIPIGAAAYSLYRVVAEWL